MLVCSYDRNHVAWFCDRALVLDEGRIVADRPPQETITEFTMGRMRGLLVVVPGFARLGRESGRTACEGA